MESPGFTEDRHDRSPGGNEGKHVSIFVNRVLRQTCRPERRQAGMLEFDISGPLEKRLIPGIRARPTPFDIVDAKFVQLAHNRQLVVYRKGDPFPLCSVAESCIERENLHRHLLGDAAR